MQVFSRKSIYTFIHLEGMERGLARCRCGTIRQHLNEKVREGFTDPKSLEMLPEKEVLRDADAEL